MTDDVVQQYRDRIADIDRGIIEAINERLKLVAGLRRHKQSRGIPFLDLAREESMLQYLKGANGGPLSEVGLVEIYAVLLDLTKRETARAEEVA